MLRRQNVKWLAVASLAATIVGCSAQGPSSVQGTPDAGEDTGTSSGGQPPPPDDSGAPDVAVAPSVDASVPVDAGPPPPPAAYVTTDDLAQALSPTPITTGDEGGMADAVVTLDPTTTYQSMLGFGASITDSSSYVMTKYLTASALQQTLVKLFDPVNGVGLNFLRQPMGASDFSSVGNFSYDDGNSDPMLANFSIAQDQKATIPVLQSVLAINKQVFIMGTPWSPPGWMKNNGSMDGSGGASGDPSLATNAYAPLAQYFVKFVQAYASAGITVGAVTPQNEPLNGSATYPGMSLDAPSETTFVGQNMGPAFKSAGLSTFIWAYDHNWDVESYPQTVMNDATAGPFTEGAAFHCYGGDPSAMSTFHMQFPNKSIYMTECSGGDWQDDPFANTIDLEISSTANWARAISLWNLALDENDGPQNNGCNDCRGVITVNSQSSAVTYNVDYYALGHFSKFVLPGAVRIASSTQNGNLNQVSFKNLDGRLAFIAHNTGNNTMTVQVGTGATAMSVQLPANAAVTISWTPSSD
jgi:glucosylceramidase